MEKTMVGIQDFMNVRDKGYCYVDKSLLIHDILSEGLDGVCLYTRPRRFGKSMNLSMIDAYFNVAYKGNTWFDGLAISEMHCYDAYRNTYPVVSLDMKTPLCRSYDTFLKSFSSALESDIRRHGYLLDSEALSEGQKAVFGRMYPCIGDTVDLQSVLADLVYLLRVHHGTPVLVLIDEYDGPMNETYGKELSSDVVSFLSTVYSSVLKGNRNVAACIMTGIMQVSKESLFSGLNNIRVNNILSTDSDERFGFTDKEVGDLCNRFGHPEKHEEVKDWYDGYRFGNADVYNPLSVMSYLKNGFVPRSYWVNTSGNDILNTLIGRTDPDTWGNLKELGMGKTIDIPVEPTVSFEDLDADPNTIYSVLAMTGYLKQSDGDGVSGVSLPNKEIRIEYSKRILNTLGIRGDSTSVFIDGLIHRRDERVKASLRQMLTLSNGRMFNDEHSYQAFIHGVLMHARGYTPTSEWKAGSGYYDILMESKVDGSPHVLLELKKATDLSVLPEKADEALEQIRDRRYYSGLKGEVLLYGIAFCGKEVLVRSDTVGI